MKARAQQERRWLETNKHRADYSEEVVTVGWLRDLCKAAIALDDIDAIAARAVDREETE